MYKKIISGVLAICTALTLTACGEDEKSSAPANSASDNTSSVSSAGSNNTSNPENSASNTSSSSSLPSDNVTQSSSLKVEVISSNEVNVAVKTDFLKDWGENKVVYLAFWSGEPGPDTKEMLVCRVDSNQMSSQISETGFFVNDAPPESFPDNTVTWNIVCDGIAARLKSSEYVEVHSEVYSGGNGTAENLIELYGADEIAKLFVGSAGGGSSSSSDTSSSSEPDTSTSEPSSSSSSGTTTPSSGESPASDFEYGIADGKMVIYRYIGSGGKVVIPSHIDGMPVERVGGNTFINLSNVTSVVFPDTVTELEISAFENCTGLQSVRLSSKISVLRNDTFYGCTSLTSVEIPNGVTAIRSNVFADCTSLTEIKIPASVTDISEDAFDNTPWKAAKLQRDKFLIVNNILLGAADQSGNITIPDGVTKIVSCFPSMFYEGTIIVPDSVTQIDANAFGNMGARISYKGKIYDMIHGEEYSIYN